MVSATSATVPSRRSGYADAPSASTRSAGFSNRRTFCSSTFWPMPVSATVDGQTALTVTPYGPNSAASDSVSPTTPNFDATYVRDQGVALLPASDEMFTMRPRPLSRRRGIAAWQVRNDALEVDADDPVPLAFRDLLERSELEHAGRIDQRVQPAQRIGGPA